MKKLTLTFALFFSIFFIGKTCAQSEYTTSVTFPANFQIGNYIEFLRVSPTDAAASGNYEISISYIRDSHAAAATHLASITHANPALWREVGRINSNPYVSAGIYNFTVDCNTEYANPRFRIRAVATYGGPNPITVYIKVRAINNNAAWTALNSSGTDLAVTKFLPMTNEWSLYVGNTFTDNGASLAIKAIENGNVGIGTFTPDAKLAVNGTIHTKEVKVDLTGWADYVFKPSYKLPKLSEVKAFITKNQHLPDMPSEKEVVANGVNLGEMVTLQTKKIEELTLYLIERDEQLTQQKRNSEKQEARILALEKALKRQKQ